MPKTISTQAALVYVMVIVSAADRAMSDREIRRIGSVVRNLPVFEGLGEERLPAIAEECAQILDNDEGLETVLGLVVRSLPKRLYETAYALAVDVAAADVKVGQEELRLLQILRHRLGLDRLVTVAIERAARARHARDDADQA
jgi:tellurite resistance protein